MASRVIIIKNLDTENERTWGSKIYQPNEEYTVLEADYSTLATDNILYEDIIDIAQVSDGIRIYTSKIDAWNYIIGNYPQEVIPTTPKNEHNLRPLGMGHIHINSSETVTVVTVSDPTPVTLPDDSTAYTYTYSGSKEPKFQDCLTQDHAQTRDGVLMYDTSSSTITAYFGSLSSGSALLCQPVIMDYHLDSTYADLYYVWGFYANCAEFGEDDIIRLQVVDKDGFGVSSGLYDQETFDYLSALNNGNGVILKEYDEVWVQQLDKINQLLTPDGSPGEVPAGLHMRMTYYARDITKTNIRFWYDYIVTFKDA